MKKYIIPSLIACAIVSASQGAVIFSDGFETGGTTLVGRSPDTVGTGTAVWVTAGGGSSATIVNDGGDRVMEVVNGGNDGFAVELSGPVVSGQISFDARFTKGATDATKNANFRAAPGPTIALNDFRSGVSLGAAGLTLNTWGDVAIVFNAGASTLIYGDSDQYSVASNKVDIWINGQLNADDQDRISGSGNLSVFGFRTFLGVVGMEFQIDDFKLNTTITMGGSTAPVLTYVPSGVAENFANDGSISDSITITLSDDEFSPDVVSGGHVVADNIPAGLTPVFNRDSDTRITLSFTGSATNHSDSDSISNLTVTFANGAFTGGDAGAVADSMKSDIGMTFATSPPPNILFIAVDDLRPDLNCYEETAAEQTGGPSARLPIHSPVMDSIASEGMVFERAYCQVSLCGPSRVSIMTGTYPDRTERYGNGGDWRVLAPNGADIVTLPQQFRNHGYYAASYGKIYDARTNVDVGLSWDEASSSGRNYTNSTNGQNRAVLEDYDVSDNEYYDGANADTALDFLATRDMNQPFFLAVGFAKPHLPFNAPKKYWDLYDPATLPLGAPTGLPVGLSDFLAFDYKELETYTQPVTYAPIVQDTMSEALKRQLIQGYLACTSYVDAQIGKITDDLKARGLYDNTIIVIWGDHGFKLGDFGQWAKATDLEVDSRVPLIIRLPPSMAVARDAHSYSMVELVDVLPTICEAAGLPVPATAQGRSLMPILKNANASVRQTALTQYRRNPGMSYSVRSAQWRYTEYRQLSGTVVDRQLFDLSSIPHVETVNVVDTEPYFAVALSALIFDYSTGASGPGKDPVPARVQGTRVSDNRFHADFSGTGTYGIWKSRSLSPALFTGPVRSGVSPGTNVELDAVTDPRAFYKILPDGVTP